MICLPVATLNTQLVRFTFVMLEMISPVWALIFKFDNVTLLTVAVVVNPSISPQLELGAVLVEVKWSMVKPVSNGTSVGLLPLLLLYRKLRTSGFCTLVIVMFE